MRSIQPRNEAIYPIRHHQLNKNRNGTTTVMGRRDKPFFATKTTALAAKIIAQATKTTALATKTMALATKTTPLVTKITAQATKTTALATKTTAQSIADRYDSPWVVYDSLLQTVGSPL